MGNLENDIRNLENRIDNFEYQNRKEHIEVRQDIQTLVTVLEAKGILPTTQNQLSMVL